MPPSIAAAIYVLGICFLFALNWDRKARTSKALWIAILWLLISGSRSVSQWLAVTGIRGNSPAYNVMEEYYEGDPIDRPVYTAILVMGLAVLVKRSSKSGRFLRENAPILLFFAYCCVSAVWSDYSMIAFKRWLKATGDLVMVMVVLTDPNRPEAIKRFLSRATFLLIPLSVLFIKYYPDIGRGYRAFKWTPLYTGVTTNKNTLGIICLLLGLASLWRFFSACGERASRRRTCLLAAHGAILGMVAWLFWMADSMTSLSCFLLAGILMAAARLRITARNPALLHWLTAVVVAVPFSTLFLDIGGSALTEMGRDPTLTGRTGIWKLVLSLTGNPLLGVGFESFWLGWRLDRVWSIMPGIQEAHNGYLEVFLNLGWIGIALMTVVMVKGYRNVAMLLRQDREFGSLMLAYFVVGIIYNFAEAGFRMTNPIWICFLLAAAAWPRIRPATQSKPLGQNGGSRAFAEAGARWRSPVERPRHTRPIYGQRNWPVAQQVHV
jgi:exopolysaccharide production protein ExoQ